ncbi:MAG: heme exporter protein CcmB [Alicyclobacillus sp.]|nr:heme exporter protein CcmB [Alicyclobacillus sp.]
MTFVRCAAALVWKDFISEFRSRQFVLSAAAFGLLLVLMMGMAVNADGRLPPDTAAGVLWMSVFFASALSFTRYDVREREFGAWFGLLSAPLDRSLIYYAKWMAALMFTCVVEIILECACAVMLNQPIPAEPWLLLGVLVGGGVALTGVGTFVSTLAAASSMREVLLPLLLFPLTLPLFLALIRLTVHAMVPAAASAGVWPTVLIGYLVIFSILPWLLFEPMMEV